MRKILKTISVCAICFCLALGLSACDKKNANVEDVDSDIYSIYQLAVAEGETRTYSEWLAEIKGSDGLTPSIGANGHWYIGLTDTGISAIGPQGPKGDQGEKGEKGEKGEAGRDGREIELRKTSTHIQWKYATENDEAWRDLYEIGNLIDTCSVTVSVNNPNLGSVNLTSIVVPKGASVVTNENVLVIGSNVITATPAADCCHFDKWIINESLSEITTDLAIVANFTIDSNVPDVLSTQGQLEYDCDDDTMTATLTFASRDLTSVSIPAYVIKDEKLYCVTKIGDNVFENHTNLLGITYTKSLKEIGDYAFRGCKGLNVALNLGESSLIHIGTSAFQHTNITTVTLPNSLTYLSANIFYGCSKLESIVIPKNVEKIESCAFFDCSKLSNVIIEGNLKIIGGLAFGHCSSLLSITLPNSIEGLGNGVFSGCYALKNIYVTDASNYRQGYFSVNGDLYYGKSITDMEFICHPAGKTTTAFEFAYPDRITSIADSAFYNCDNLTSITIPENVTNIGYDAFFSCSRLANIVLSNGLKSIGASAFYGCDSLEKIILPASVDSIRSTAFSSCTRLTVYAMATSEPAEWKNYNWNTSNRPVYWYSETQPTEEGSFWHYGTDGVTPIVWEAE